MAGANNTVHPARSRRWLVDELIYFSWWIRLQQRVEAWPRRSRFILIGVALVIGTGARLWAHTIPGNWDFHQWLRLSSAIADGVNPYVDYIYNWPPPWLLTITAMNAVTGSDEAFRLLLVTLLTAVDIGIVLLLARRGYTLASVLFMLSPVTIAISGHHHQVEGIAVFLTLAAVTVLTADASDRITAKDWGAAALLGLSLSYKPVFLLFPLWLALRPGPWRKRLFQLLAPLGVFAAFFASAFVAYSPSTVIPMVLGEVTANNSPLIRMFVPGQFAPWLLEHGGGKLALLLLLVIAGLLFRKLPPFELALAYSISALTFSHAVVNQYLVIPMAAMAVFLNLGFLLWLALSTLWLAGDVDSLRIAFITPIQQNVMLVQNQAVLDMFPYLLIGWLLFAFAIRRRGWHMTPRVAAPKPVTSEPAASK